MPPLIPWTDVFFRTAASVGMSFHRSACIGDGKEAEADMRGTQKNGGRVLIVEADRALAGLFADVIATHCPGMRIDVCAPEEHGLLHDNAGGADVVVCSCGPSG